MHVLSATWASSMLLDFPTTPSPPAFAGAGQATVLFEMSIVEVAIAYFFRLATPRLGVQDLAVQRSYFVLLN